MGKPSEMTMLILDLIAHQKAAAKPLDCIRWQSNVVETAVEYHTNVKQHYGTKLSPIYSLNNSVSWLNDGVIASILTLLLQGATKSVLLPPPPSSDEVKLILVGDILTVDLFQFLVELFLYVEKWKKMLIHTC